MMTLYVINLDRDVRRLEQLSLQLDGLGLPFERIAAVDGRDVSDSDYHRFQQARPRQNKRWLRGQMGCFLSHYKAWEKIAAGAESYGVVLEDDIYLSGDAGCYVTHSDWIPESADVIRLEPSTNRMLLARQEVLQLGGRVFYPVKSTAWCAGAYILSRRAAKQLIELPASAHQPADAMLFSFQESVIARQLQILQCSPAPCIQDKFRREGYLGLGSNIEVRQRGDTSYIRTLRSGSYRELVQTFWRTLRGYRRIGFLAKDADHAAVAQGNRREAQNSALSPKVNSAAE
ncbi:glycosyltransferase family 25 protein [Marinobacter sp. 1Y8]